MLIHILIKLLPISFLLVFHYSLADLEPIDDKGLSHVDGEGIGLVLEDFLYNAGQGIGGRNAEIEISGLETSGSNSKSVILDLKQLYIAGSNSQNGTNVEGNTVNIGRLTNPFNIELLDGDTVGVDNKAVFEFAAPNKNSEVSYFRNTGTLSRPSTSVVTFNSSGNVTGSRTNSNPFGSRVNGISNIRNNVISSRASERPDLGIRFGLNIDGSDKQVLQNHIESLAIDGSTVRLWGSGDHVEAQVNLNIYSPNIEFIACNANSSGCGDSVSFGNVGLEVGLGYGEKQPLTFEVNSTGNFVFELASLQGKCSTSTGIGGGCSDGRNNAFFNDYYSNGPAINAHVENVNIGNASPGDAGYFGSSTISNLQIQYLRIESRDL